MTCPSPTGDKTPNYFTFGRGQIEEAPIITANKNKTDKT